MEMNTQAIEACLQNYLITIQREGISVLSGCSSHITRKIKSDQCKQSINAAVLSTVI